MHHPSAAEARQLCIRLLKQLETGCSAQEPSLRDGLGKLPPAKSTDPELAALIGAAWVRVGERDKAWDYLNQDWQAASATAAGFAGSALLASGWIEPSIPALRRAAKLAPGEGSYSLNLARALLLVDEVEEAWSWLEQATTALGENHGLLLQTKAEALLQQNKLDEALTLLPPDSRDPAIVTGRASLLACAGRHDEANQYIQCQLKEQPEWLDLRLMAAELARIRGRYGEALYQLHQALQKNPDQVELLVQFACSHPPGSTSPDCRRAAERALELTEGARPQQKALAQMAMAHVLEQEGEHQQALEKYEQAISIDPTQIQALSGKGHLLLQLGDVSAAVACFEQLRTIAPLQGWCQLIQARRLPDDPGVLATMEEIARRPSLEGLVRTGLLFTLAAAYDRQGDYRRAFATAHEANQASKALISYQPAEHRQRIEHEIGVFNQTFMAQRAEWGVNSLVPVFVLGMPRSGTTLVEQILASHSQVHGAGELGLIHDLISRLEQWEHQLGSGLHYPECLEELTATECQGFANTLLNQLHQYNISAARIIDKLPHNFEHIGLIKLLFPNAAIIHVRRDPRDIAISNYFTDYAAKHGGMGFAYDLEWIAEQLQDQQRLLLHWKEIFPNQIFELSYEDLVSEPETWARRLIEHLALEWEPEVLQFQELKRAVKTASVWQVRQPVYRSSLNRWEHYSEELSASETLLNQPLPAIPTPQADQISKPGRFSEAMQLLQTGAAAAAEAVLRDLLSQRPNHAAARQFLGVALFMQGQSRAAQHEMKRSLELISHHPTWWENLAAVQRELGDADGALASQAEAEKQSPNRLQHVGNF
jgi:tetratricopeptide (TPR) repeat protein